MLAAVIQADWYTHARPTYICDMYVTFWTQPSYSQCTIDQESLINIDITCTCDMAGARLI